MVQFSRSLCYHCISTAALNTCQREFIACCRYENNVEDGSRSFRDNRCCLLIRCPCLIESLVGRLQRSPTVKCGQNICICILYCMENEKISLKRLVLVAYEFMNVNFASKFHCRDCSVRRRNASSVLLFVTKIPKIVMLHYE